MSPIDRQPDHPEDNHRPRADIAPPAYADPTTPLAEFITREAINQARDTSADGNIGPSEVPEGVDMVVDEEEGDTQHYPPLDNTVAPDIALPETRPPSATLDTLTAATAATSAVLAIPVEVAPLPSRAETTIVDEHDTESTDGDGLESEESETDLARRIPDATDNPAAADGGSDDDTPDNPRSVAEFGPPEPSPLARAISDRYMAEQTKAWQAMYPRGTDHTASQNEMSKPNKAMQYTYMHFVQHRLDRPGVTVEPRQLADDVVTDLVNYAVARMYPDRADKEVGTAAPETLLPPGEYDKLRNYSAGQLIPTIDSWNHGNERPDDGLAFERLQPHAETVAARHNVEPADVFADDALYHEAFREAYPRGPSQYVQERMQAQGQGYALARRVAHSEFTVGFTESPSDRAEAIATACADSSVLAAREYMFRTRFGTKYDTWTLQTLELTQEQQIQLTQLRIEDVWGEDARSKLSERELEWLNGDLLVTPERMLPTADRSRFDQVVLIHDDILARGHEGLAVGEETFAQIANVLAEYIVRVRELSSAELMAIVQMFDSTMTAEYVKISEKPIDVRLDDDPIGDYLARLHVDNVIFGPLNVEPDAATLNESSMAMLRNALVARQIRLLFAEPFPETVRNHGALYYSSDRFLQFNQFFQQVIDRYLPNPESDHTTDGTTEPLGGTGGIAGIPSRIIVEAQSIEEWEIPVDTDIANSEALAAYLMRLGTNSGIFIEQGTGGIGVIEDNRVKLDHRDIHISPDRAPRGPDVYNASLSTATPAMGVTVRAYYDRTVETSSGEVQSEETAIQRVVDEYAAARTLELLHTSREDLLAPTTMAFLRYTSVDPTTGRAWERIAHVVQPPDTVIPHARRLFGPEGSPHTPMHDDVVDTVTRVARSLAALHAKGFRADGNITLDTVGENVDVRPYGQQFCLNLAYLQPMSANDPDDMYEGRMSDIRPLWENVLAYGTRAGMDMIKLRHTLYGSYATLTRNMLGQDAEIYLRRIRETLGIKDL